MDLEAYVDVVPWLLFVVVDGRAGLGPAWAGVSAMGCGAAIAGWSHWRRRSTPIGWVAVAVFGSLVVVALVVVRPQPWFQPTLRAASVLVLGLTAFASLRGRPLSETYTAERVAADRRAELAFARVNRRITCAWGVGAVLVAGSFAVVGAMPSALALTMFDWAVPMAVLGAVLRWAAVQWSTYEVDSDGVEAASPTEVRVRLVDLVNRPVSGFGNETSVPPPEPRITYLPGARPGS